MKKCVASRLSNLRLMVGLLSGIFLRMGLVIRSLWSQMDVE